MAAIDLSGYYRHRSRPWADGRPAAPTGHDLCRV